eukprot:5789410-Pyramimonas_sp.AAC.1
MGLTLLWGSLGWMVFFLSMFFVGAGMMYAACFLLHWFRERQRDSQPTYGEVTYISIGSE